MPDEEATTTDNSGSDGANAGTGSGESGFMLERFLDAQNSVYCRVCAELQQGFKRSHWMWFIFPQIEGLGHNPMARKFEPGFPRSNHLSWI